MNTHKRTRTCTHDAGRQVAPLVLLSIHPSYHRTEHMCTPTHAHIDTDRKDRGGSDADKCNEENRDKGNRAVQALVTEKNATEATLGTTACLNTHTRTRTFTHDAGRQVAPLVLLSIHPSYHRTEHMCTRTHAHIDTDSEDRGGSDAGKCNEGNRDRGNRAVQTLVTEENATETTAAETISGARGTHARTHARMDCLL